MKHTLLVDIDGTIRDVWGDVNAYILAKYGVALPDVWDHYDTARTTVGDEAANEAFAVVCGSYDGAAWYPGAWSAIVELRRDGIDPVFCTLNPSRQARTIAREIAPLYGAPPHVERVTNSANKLKVARRLGAVGIVDDKPATLEAFKAAGLFTATYDHLYNRDIKVDCRFSDWRAVNLAQELRRHVWYQPELLESEAC